MCICEAHSVTDDDAKSFAWQLVCGPAIDNCFGGKVLAVFCFNVKYFAYIIFPVRFRWQFLHQIFLHPQQFVTRVCMCGYVDEVVK